MCSIAKGNLIVGVVSHEFNQYDITGSIEASRGKAVKQAVCDRGCRGKQDVNGTPSYCRKSHSIDVGAISAIKSNIANVLLLS